MRHIDIDDSNNPWKDCHTFCAIGPQGQVSIRHIPKGMRYMSQKIGASIIKWDNGHAYVDDSFKSKGWVMYDELCSGRVDGVAADTSKLDIWQRFVKAKGEGMHFDTETLNSAKFWHAEVIKRREYAAKHGRKFIVDKSEAANLLFGEEPKKGKG